MSREVRVCSVHRNAFFFKADSHFTEISLECYANAQSDGAVTWQGWLGWLGRAGHKDRTLSTAGRGGGGIKKPPHSATESNPFNPRWYARARQSPPQLALMEPVAGQVRGAPGPPQPPRVEQRMPARQPDVSCAAASAYRTFFTGRAILKAPCYLSPPQRSKCLDLCEWYVKCHLGSKLHCVLSLQ